VCGHPLVDARAVDRVQQKLASLGATRVREVKIKMEAKHQHEVQLAKQQGAERERKLRSLEQQRNERHIAGLERKISELKRQNEKSTSEQRGELGEAEVLLSLEKASPKDRIVRLGKRRGSADIMQEVVGVGGRICGKIIYECKDTKGWSESYVTQALAARSVNGTPHVILVSNKFPNGSKHLCFRRQLPVVHPLIVAHVATFVRESILVAASTKTSPAERERKVARVYDFIRSVEFVSRMRSVAETIEDLRKLQGTEKKQHAKTWQRQQAYLDAIGTATVEIHERIETILSEARRPLTVARTKLAS